MEALLKVIIILFINGMIYSFIRIKKKAYYNLLLILISIFSYTIFYVLFFTKEFSFFKNFISEGLATINIILPLILVFKPDVFYNKIPSFILWFQPNIIYDKVPSFSFVLIWLFTIISGLYLISGYGVFFLFFTQPCTYLLCVYKIKNNDERVISPLIINFCMTIVIAYLFLSF